MTRAEHIHQIVKQAEQLDDQKPWQELCADVARIRGACMSLMVELHAEYIQSMPRSTLVITSPQRLTVDDI